MRCTAAIACYCILTATALHQTSGWLHAALFLIAGLGAYSLGTLAADAELAAKETP